MSTAAPPVLVLVLVTLLSALVTASALHCPSTQLCGRVCAISPVLAGRCELCHPGVCLGGRSKEVEPALVYRGPPRSKSAATDGEVKPEVVYRGPPQSTSDVSDGESIEEDDEDISNEGSGTVDDEDSESVESATVDKTIQDIPETLDEEAAPNETTKSEETEPTEIEPEEADPEQPESEEKEHEQAEPEEPEPSKHEDKKPEEEESKPKPIDAEDLEPQEKKPEGTKPKETKPAQTKTEETEPEESRTEVSESDETEQGLEETESAEDKPEKDKPEKDKPEKSKSEEDESEEDESEEDKSEEDESEETADKNATSQETPKPDADSTEKPKENKPDEPSHRNKTADPSYSKDPAASSVTPAPRGFGRRSRTSAIACLHNGVYHPLHSTWFDIDHCNLHVCTIQGVQTTSLTGSCLPPPDDMSQCRRYRLPGQCCYTYDCQTPGNNTASQPCLDQFGVERQHNEHWMDNPDHPCVRFFCADGVVVVLSDMRPLCPAPPSHGCTAFQPLGMCCNDFNCTDAPALLSCIDAQNVRRDNGQVWYDNDVLPCRKFVCNNGTVELLKDLSLGCAPPPGPGCVPLPVSGRCCPTFANCSCRLAGVEFLSGAMFPDDPTFPCRRLKCDNGTLVTLEERQCPTLSCSPKFRRPGGCCYECVGCVHQGVRRPEGSFWYDSPQRPCVLFTCSNSLVVEVNRTECQPSPGPYCQPVIQPGDCCALYDCSAVTCQYGDQTYHEDDVWVDDPVYPCKWFTCRRTGVQQVNNTYCPPLVPRDCPTKRDPGRCCHSCHTGPTATCFYNDRAYLQGDIWVDDPDYPCKWFICRRTGVQQVNNTYCPPLVPRDCPTQRDPGQCCHSCQTTDGCVDASGVAREDGELYYLDPERCRLARCVGDQEVLLVDRTQLCPPPPNINCTVVGVVNCCPQYLCHLMPISNCTDAAGRHRDNGEIYSTDAAGCVLVECVDGSEKLLVDRSTLCPPPYVDIEQNGCVQSGVQDCCPVYNCSGSVECVDASGTQHSNGDMYYDDSAGCVLVECSDGQEVTILDKTDGCSPAPGNPACVVQSTLDCCAIYECPDCTYNGTTYPIGAHWWDDPERQCLRFRCSPEGLVQQVLTRLPCAEVRFGCVPVRDEPACCHHKYNCMFDYEHNLIPMLELAY